MANEIQNGKSSRNASNGEGEVTERMEEAKTRALAEMADVIGHDLKNSLSNIKNCLYLIKKAVDSQDATANRMVEIIEQEVDSSTGMLNNLTGYARHRPPFLSSISVGDLIEETIAEIELPEQIKIDKNIQSDLPCYNLDKGEIKLALLNIISNAAEAYESGEGLIELKAFTDTDKGKLKIVIRDHGKGIEPEKLEEVCKPFTSTKNGRTGLGMAAAKRLAERNHGSLDISSEPGCGTEVVISLSMMLSS